MKNIGISLLLMIIFYSCSDNDLPSVNGMWQLKTVENEGGDIQIVDTIYYSFQRQAIFSYTLLHESPERPARTDVFYGYVNFPDNNTLSIQLDKKYDERYDFDHYPRLEKNMEYNILHLDTKKMILFYAGETYSFIKF